ncbi:unnamed protein product [Mytilus coruscus]|uniref:Uncharacterized protein n=1 Tax=Mytilus coruscus TaxID=42192 RepID=A0A6J8EA45_MYTCO|nr:unnamed protein product [Mytilus coruscus]
MEPVIMVVPCIPNGSEAVEEEGLILGVAIEDSNNNVEKDTVSVLPMVDAGAVTELPTINFYGPESTAYETITTVPEKSSNYPTAIVAKIPIHISSADTTIEIHVSTKPQDATLQSAATSDTITQDQDKSYVSSADTTIEIHESTKPQDATLQSGATSETITQDQDKST